MYLFAHTIQEDDPRDMVHSLAVSCALSALCCTCTIKCGAPNDTMRDAKCDVVVIIGSRAVRPWPTHTTGLAARKQISKLTTLCASCSMAAGV